MAEEDVSSLLQSSEFSNLLQTILNEQHNEEIVSSSPVDSPDTLYEMSSDPEDDQYNPEQLTAVLTQLSNVNERKMELRNYSLQATFGTRRKPEMPFVISLVNCNGAFTTLSEKCSIELNSDFNRKIAKQGNRIWKTGYCVHACLWIKREESSIVDLVKNGSPLSFVHQNNRFATFKEGVLKLRIRENLSLKQLVTKEKSTPQLLIQFILSFQGEKLLETERLPISFGASKKKTYEETTEIIKSPSKLPLNGSIMMEPATKRIKSDQFQQPCINPSFYFPASTSATNWNNSNSAIDIINYLENQILIQQQGYVTQNVQPSVVYTTVPQKYPRNTYQQPSPTDLYSNIQIKGAFGICQPIGEILPTMVPRSIPLTSVVKEEHKPIDSNQMETWLASLSS
jgi:hypothetical protein